MSERERRSDTKRKVSSALLDIFLVDPRVETRETLSFVKTLLKHREEIARLLRMLEEV